MVFRNADERKSLCKIFVDAWPVTIKTVLVIIPGEVAATLLYDRTCGRVVRELVNEHNFEETIKC